MFETEKVNYNLLINNLEKQINELKVEYEAYFMGVRDNKGTPKREPAKLKSTVEKVIRDLSNKNLGNAAYNFRFNQLVARFNSYNQYWLRIVRKIEDGTYERDKFKLALKEKEQFSLKQPPLQQQGNEAVKEVNEFEKLYNELIEAKKKCNEQIDTLKYEKFKQLLEKQAESLKNEYKCNKVDFQVVIDGGKTKIKAVPK